MSNKKEATHGPGDPSLTNIFQNTAEEGARRLQRTWPGLLATGVVGGIDVGLGVFALLVVEHETHNPLLGALAFSIGFIALTLASSELFTENFLVPISAVVTGHAGVAALFRLWAGTAVMNLAGGWLITLFMMDGLPSLRPTAIRVATIYTEIGLEWRSLALAILGGVLITLMTWMEHASKQQVAKLAAAVSAAFLLAAGTLNHAIVVSLIMFAGLHTDAAPYGYIDWLGEFGWASLGNALGGIGLVTMLRFIQVGGDQVSPRRGKRG